ncbi:MAG: hypothetical protein LBD57_04365 [Endomicrobium sp.]|uniref:hypothetical protein n=1 Tax=Candidatus Endomicrobiellum cubanum TaxID=3242325 RepID=UPI002829DFBF|nr:hypothetical protein [Endomicrobium sp.]
MNSISWKEVIANKDKKSNCYSLNVEKILIEEAGQILSQAAEHLLERLLLKKTFSENFDNSINNKVDATSNESNTDNLNATSNESNTDNLNTEQMSVNEVAGTKIVNTEGSIVNYFIDCTFNEIPSIFDSNTDETDSAGLPFQS